MTPRPISFFITSPAVIFSLDASSPTVISSGTVIWSGCFFAFSTP